MVPGMHETPTRTAPDRNTSGGFNYLDDGVKPSLYRNGRVLTRRDADGNDDGTTGLSTREVELDVFDARALVGSAPLTCDANGFELLDAPLPDDRFDFLDHATVVTAYYGQCARLVAERTGARVFPFDHNIRSISGKRSARRIAGGQQVQEPLHLVHGDYTLTSAPQRLRDLTRPPGGNDTLSSILPAGETLIDPATAERALDGGRFAIVNVWRNIAETPVEAHPLALCDSRTVVPDDLVVFEIHYRDRIGENYFARHADAHRWYYYPRMTRDEALLIKQWDSAGTFARTNGTQADAEQTGAPRTFSFHSAFDDANAPQNAPDRWSIEVRCMVVYDGN